jgi:hypothetical protein
VANDALYLIRAPDAFPVRIAGPLYPASVWSATYYGEIDWRIQFAWGA